MQGALNAHHGCQFPMLNVIVVLNFLHDFLSNHQPYSWRCFQDFLSRVRVRKQLLISGGMCKDRLPLLQTAVYLPCCVRFSCGRNVPLGGWEGRRVARGLVFTLSCAVYGHLPP